MKIKKAIYVGSAIENKQYPNDSLYEIAFLGRSNVGKSSLINFLTNNKKIAKISKIPGKTKTINFFIINDLFYFVDLPGYGYSNISKKYKKIWQNMIENYLKNRKLLISVFLLLDIRRIPSEEDFLMLNYLKFYKIKTIYVLTKTDKLSFTKAKNQKEKIKKYLNLNNENILMCSTEKKSNVNLLINEIDFLLSEES